MTKDLKTIDINLLPLETLAEMANEAAEQFEENAKKTVQKALDAGRYLIAAKEQLTHGEWGKWLGTNWNYTPRTASGYMLLAFKSETISDLITAKNYNAAMRMIAAEKADLEQETAARSERKTATVKVSIPDDSTRVLDDPGDPDADQDDDNSLGDDDPAPDPPTQRKTAKGSEKVSEGKKPRTAAMTPEILPDEEDEPDPIDDWMGCRSLEDVALRWLGETPDATAKKSAAKHLRKLADKLDPPTKFVKPDGNDVLGFLSVYTAEDKFIAEHGARSPEQIETAADGFIDHYSSNGWMVGKVKMSDWRATARKWVKNEGQFLAGKGNGNGTANRGTNRRAGPTAESVFGID